MCRAMPRHKEAVLYPLVICACFLGMFAMLPTILSGYDVAIDRGKAHSMAANYCAYRSAVCQYIQDHSITASIPQSSLQLPRGYTYLASWQTRIIGNFCYIYGPITEGDLPIIRKRLGNSLRVGLNTGGRLEPGDVPVPSDIPTGTIVSIVSMQ